MILRVSWGVSNKTVCERTKRKYHKIFLGVLDYIFILSSWLHGSLLRGAVAMMVFVVCFIRLEPSNSLEKQEIQ